MRAKAASATRAIGGVVPGGGEHGVGRVAFAAPEIIAVHAVVCFCVTDNGLDLRALPQVTLDGVGDAAFFWPEM
jgi:hypothetical protein